MWYAAQENPQSDAEMAEKVRYPAPKKEAPPLANPTGAKEGGSRLRVSPEVFRRFQEGKTNQNAPARCLKPTMYLLQYMFPSQGIAIPCYKYLKYKGVLLRGCFLWLPGKFELVCYITQGLPNNPDFGLFPPWKPGKIRQAADLANGNLTMNNRSVIFRSLEHLPAK